MHQCLIDEGSHPQLKAKRNNVSFIVDYILTLDKSTSENDTFCRSPDEVVEGVPSRDHLLVLMDANARIVVVKGVPSRDHLLALMNANARTCTRGIGWTDDKV